MAARIPPGTRADVGAVNWLIARAIGVGAGGHPPNVFTTLARNRSLFRRWLPFAGGLMPGGRLPREDAELVILRVAHNCGSAYEWGHHQNLGRAAGLSDEELARVRSGPDAPGWSARQALLLRTADALHADRDVDDALWAALHTELGGDERLLIELPLLIGHYEMLAMTLNTLRVEPDARPLGRQPALVRAVTRALRRGR
jgi:alkylhydroperoxidase family enzyme